VLFFFWEHLLLEFLGERENENRRITISDEGRIGKVGEAQSYLFDAADFVKFAIKWLEKEFSR
jgi:hypothetical protein